MEVSIEDLWSKRRPGRRGPAPKSVVERFFAALRVTSGDGCWIGGGCFTSTREGYPVIHVGHRADGSIKWLRSARVAFALVNGRWPNPQGRHTCDNPACVRPKHLLEGTHADNMADMVSRGRAPGGKAGRKGRQLSAAERAAQSVYAKRRKRDGGRFVKEA